MQMVEWLIMVGSLKVFFIKQGVRQGCPLYALLFIIVAEVLASKIKQNPNIIGIKIPYH